MAVPGFLALVGKWLSLAFLAFRPWLSPKNNPGATIGTSIKLGTHQCLSRSSAKFECPVRLRRPFESVDGAAQAGRDRIIRSGVRVERCENGKMLISKPRLSLFEAEKVSAQVIECL